MRPSISSTGPCISAGSSSPHRFGYQHLWNEAAGTSDSVVRVTWLDGSRYYTATTAASAGTEVIFARTGASDSLFNLIVEPMYLLRRRGREQLFASVIEPHGYFNEAQERSEQARPLLTRVQVLASDATGSVIEVTGARGIRWQIHVAHGAPSTTAARTVRGIQTFTFTGNVQVTGLEPLP